MKKINLKGLMETLSEKELKGVMAGSGGDTCGGTSLCDYTSACTNNAGVSGHCGVIITGYCKCIGNH